MASALARAIEVLHHELLIYRAGGDHARVNAAIGQFVAAGRAAGVLLPALIGSFRTLWQHDGSTASGAVSGTGQAMSEGDARFDGFVRVLLAEYDRAGG